MWQKRMRCDDVRRLSGGLRPVSDLTNLSTDDRRSDAIASSGTIAAKGRPASVP